MKFLLNEITGKTQGERIIVDADTPELAIEKLRDGYEVVEVIKPYERFSRMHFGGKMYMMHDYGSPEKERFVLYLKDK